MSLPPLAARIERAHPLAVILALCALHTALELPHLGRPPTGFHLWRQTQTLAVARNFHQEEMNVLRPRADARGSGPGIAGMEFPLVSYAIACGYRMFGERDAVHRVVLLGFSLLAIAGCYAWVTVLLSSPLAGAIAGAILVLSPLFDYYSIAALPDVPMLAFLFLGLAGLRAGAASGRLGVLWAGTGALALAGLIKISSLLAWPAALVTIAPLWRARSVAWRGSLAAGLAIATGAILGWYVYARHLSDTYGVHDFRLVPDFPYPLSVVPPILKKVLFQWTPEVALSYPEFAAFLLGLFALAAPGAALLRRFGWLYAAGLALYFAAFLPMLDVSDYYLVVALPLLVLIATLGTTKALAMARGRASRIAVAALGIAALVVGPYRAQSRYARGGAPEDLTSLAPVLDRVLPDRATRVIAASDRSPSIYLYFMRRKGWVTNDAAQPERFGEALREGARFLVCDSRAFEARPEVRPWLRPIASHGRFNVFALELPR